MQAVIQTFLNPILPVFAIMLIGMVCAGRGMFDAAAARAINRFVFFVAVPALLFSLLSEAKMERVEWELLALYFLSEIVLFTLGSLAARFMFKRKWGEALLMGMASCFVNHVFFVLPIAQVIYGDQAAAPITAIIVVDTAIIFSGTIMGLEIATHRGESPGKVLAVFIRNPVLVSIFLGLLANLMDIPIHEGIQTFTTFAGSAAAPAALFSLGIILTERGERRLDLPALVITGLKVLIHPLTAWLLFGTVAVGGIWHDSALLVAAGPCGAMPFVLALQYGIRAESIGRAIIYSTVASLFTLAVIA